MQPILATIASLALATTLAAQANGVTARNYGTRCSLFTTSSINASYDITTRQLSITVDPSFTCCNTFLSGQWLLVGAQPITPGLPLDFAGFLQGCELAVLPFAAIGGGGRGSNTWTFGLPPLTPGDAFYFQGVNDYFTTIGFTHDWQTSDGLEIVIL